MSRAILAPFHGLAVCIDKNPVRLILLNKRSLLCAVAYSSLTPAGQPLTFGQGPRTMEMHAPTKIPSTPLREEPYKIRPDLSG